MLICQSKTPVILGALLLMVALYSCSIPNGPGEDREQMLDSLLREGIEMSADLKFEKAHSRLTRLAEKAKKAGSKRYEVLSYINLGALYLKFNSDEQGLKFFRKSLEKAKEYELTTLLNTIYNNLGLIYSENDSPKKAARYFKKALTISREQHDTLRVAMNLINLGIAQYSKKRGPKAVRYYREALGIFLETGDSLHASVALNNIANVSYDNKDYRHAREQYQHALKLATRLGDKFYESEYRLNLAKTLYQFGQYDSSIASLEAGLEGFKKTSNTEYIIKSNDWLAKNYQKLNRPAKALSYAQYSSAWRDTLLREKTGKYMSEMEMNYEFGRKQREVQLLQEQARRRQYFWISVVVLGLLFSFLVFHILRTKNVNLNQRNTILNNEREMNRLEMEKNEAQRGQLEKELKAGREMARLEKERFEQELRFKNRELSTKALHLVKKNETFNELKQILEGIKSNGSTANNELLNEARSVLRNNASTDRDWETFKMHFQEVHPEFFMQLEQDYPALGDGDLRLCTYLLIGLNSKEIAQVINISPASVRKRKQRLREKLGLKQEEAMKILLSRYRKA